MLPETLQAPWVKGKATNFTSNFQTIKSSTTMPSGNGVIDLNSVGASTCNALMFRFFGTDTNNENFNIRIYGWSQAVSGGVPVSWEFLLLCQLAITLGNLGGTTGCAIGASDFEADTIALTYGNDDISVSIVSPANDIRGAYVQVDTLGSGLVQIDGDLNSSAVSWNYLWKKM